MLEEVPGRLFDEWEEHYQREPWGGAREDYRIAKVVCMIFNTQRGENTAPLKVEEVFANLAPEPVSAEEAVAQARQQYQLMKAREGSTLSKREREAWGVGRGA